MNTEVIVTGKTVEEAVKTAREKYGTDNNEITYEILELPKKGFLGFGASPAKVKVKITEIKNILSELNLSGDLNVNVPSPQPQPRKQPPQTQQPKPQNNPKTANQNQNQTQNNQKPKAPANEQPSSARPPQRLQQLLPKQPKPQVQANAASAGAAKAGTQNQQPKTAPAPKPSAMPSETPAPPAKRVTSNEQNNKPPKNEARVKPKSTYIPKEDAEEITLSQGELDCAMNFLNMVLSHMELDQVSAVPLELSEKRINIDGEGAGALIGHHGDTLDALQYLTNLHINRKADAADPQEAEKRRKREYVKVTIDIGGYRARREETLRAFARRMADRALKYKKNVFLEPMNPYERRIIHSEVQLIDGVSTHSVGSDDNRKIVITVDNLPPRPKKQKPEQEVEVEVE